MAWAGWRRRRAACARGWAYVRYDHFAHGRSSGDWRKATIGRWREDAVALIDSLSGPVIPVGSSMGGWVSLLASLARPDRIKGLVLVNPAQDFTERLMWPGLADHVQAVANALSPARGRIYESAGARSYRDRKRSSYRPATGGRRDSWYEGRAANILNPKL